MSAPRDSVRRLPSAADLPKLPAPLPLQLRSDTGNVIAKVRWIDTREMLFWSIPVVPSGRDILARITLAPGSIVDVTLRVLEGEAPVRSGDGHIHVARWIGTNDTDRAQLVTALQALNPEVFSPDYRHPRPPRKVDRTAALAAQRAAETAALEARKEEYARQLADCIAARKRVSARIRAQAGLVGLIAASAGFLGVMVADGFQTARWLLFTVNAPVATQYGLLAGIELPGAILDSVTLAEVNLEQAMFTGASMRHANLAGANLAGARLERSDLRGTNLAGANLDGAALRGARLNGADLRGAKVQSTLEFADFHSAFFDANTKWPATGAPHGALGPGGRAEQLSFEGVKAAGWNLDGIVLDNSKLVDCDFAGASFVGGSLKNVHFQGSLLEKMNGERGDFSGANCAACEVSGALLVGANLSEGNWAGAKFVDSTAKDITAIKADFSGSDFQGADWSGANLTGANLSGAHMLRASLSHSQLWAANLSGTDLTSTNLSGSVADFSTIWPDGFVASAAGVSLLVPGATLVAASWPDSLDISSRGLAGLTAKGLRAKSLVAKQTNLSGAQLAGATLEQADFAGAVLTAAVFSAATLDGSTFVGADLTRAKLDGAKICGVDFTAARLGGVEWRGAVACAATIWPENKTPAGVKVQHP